MSVHQLPPAVQKAREEEQRRNFALHITQDFMCYPQLNAEDDPFADDESFAQRLRDHIEFCIEDPETDQLSETTVY